MNKIATSSYRPDSNSAVERVSDNIEQMLSMVINDSQKYMEDYLHHT